MNNFVLVTETTANSGRLNTYEFLASLNGSVHKDVNLAIKFDSEEQIKAHGIKHGFILFDCDSENNLKRLGYLM